MGIYDPLQAEKIAIVEAFGLSADNVPVDGIDIRPETVVITEYRPESSVAPFVDHEFHGGDATGEQRAVVNAYLQKCAMTGWWPAIPHPAQPVKGKRP
jgi:hypothetical protein